MNVGATLVSLSNNFLTTLSAKGVAILNHAHTTVRSITKTVRIDCNPQAAFECLTRSGSTRPFALVEPHASFTLVSRHSNDNQVVVLGRQIAFCFKKIADAAGRDPHAQSDGKVVGW